MSKIKKTLPKVKKKLKDFLTDESGKITKKDALGLSAGAALFAGAEEVIAASSYTRSTPPNSAYPSNSAAYRPPNHTNAVSNSYYRLSNVSCNHASGIVNGHYSSTPSARTGTSPLNLTTTHSSHGSHGSHGSW